MPAGTTYKQCSCRDDHGRRLGQKCAKLRRANGTWSSRHGTWYYQVELPPNPDGSRRNPLRRGGFATQDDDAEQELAAARDLLAIAPPGDVEGRIQIADLIQRAVKATRQLPDAPGSRAFPDEGEHAGCGCLGCLAAHAERAGRVLRCPAGICPPARGCQSARNREHLFGEVQAATTGRARRPGQIK